MKKSYLTLAGILFILCILSTSCVEKEHLKAKRIDTLMTYCFENGLFNGTILVSNKGKVIYEKAFGYSNIQSKELLTLNSPFYLASLSKPFTSTAITILKEQGKLSLDNKLSDYFPEFSEFANTITIKHLLHHQSGIPNYTTLKEFRSKTGNLIDGVGNQDIYNFLLKLESLEFIPGEKYKYSNSGFVLLSMIVEKVSGLSFPVFMRQNIFDSLSMKNTFVWEKSQSEVTNRAKGFNKYGEIDDYNLFATGAGGMYSTVNDLYKFDQALYTSKIISHVSFRESISPQSLNDGSKYINRNGWSYGYGWEVRKDSLSNVVRHSGGFNGFSTVFYRELLSKSAIILLTNKGQNSWQRGPTMVAIINILKDRAYTFPKIPITIKLKDMIDNEGVEDIYKKLISIKEDNDQKYLYSRSDINSLGYFYFSKDKLNASLAVFKINCQLYPESYNVWDSYAECLFGMEQYKQALQYYNKSVILNPKNIGAVEMIERIKKILN